MFFVVSLKGIFFNFLSLSLINIKLFFVSAVDGN